MSYQNIVINKAVSHYETKMRAIIDIALGNLFLIVCSQISISIGPVPLSFQTLGIFIIALFYGGWKAFFSSLLYLIEANCGLPVLAGWTINPLWILGPCTGYLCAFPIGAFVIGKLTEGKNALSFPQIVCRILAGQGIILLLGTVCLMAQIGVFKGFTYGLLPFIVPGLIKSICAASLRDLL